MRKVVRWLKQRRTMAVLALYLVPSVLAAQVSPSHAGHVKNIEENIRRVAAVREHTTIEARMRALNVPAVSIAVVDSGRIVWAKAYGLADVARNIPATPSTRFQAASISKPVASVAALRLVQDGKLSLDADINSFLRSWKLPANALTARTPVTLRMLLTHTAGTTVHGFPGYAVNAPVPTAQQTLDGISPSNTPAVRVDVAPGTTWRYSGGGMTIAQLMMTDITGENFPELMRRLVLAPAGMTSSSYEQPLPDSLRATAAVAYGSNGAPLPGGHSHTYPEMMAAGLWTTPTDLARFVIEVQRAFDGSSAVLNQTMARAFLTPGRGNWGLGIQMIGAGASARFTHGGANAGFRGEFVGYVRGGRGVAVLTNGNNGSQLAAEVIAAVGREYNWPGMGEGATREEVAIDLRLLDGYVGRYQMAADFVATIARVGNQLTIQRVGGRPIPLFPQGPKSFFAKELDLTVEFETDAQGKVIAAVVAQDGNARRGARLPGG